VLSIRPAEERGRAQLSWLDSRHSFSFAEYYDPKHLGFRSLRVINEDRVAPGRGFSTHPHRDMEIISYVLGGELEHRDSLGTGSVIRPGDVQRMSAGSGISHSEFNASRSEPVHFLQIWLEPSRRGLPPSYEQRSFSDTDKRSRLLLVASPDGRDGSVMLHSDALVYVGLFDARETGELNVAKERYVWLQVARGAVRLNGNTLNAGDGAALEGERAVRIEGLSRAEILLFDLG